MYWIIFGMAALALMLFLQARRKRRAGSKRTEHSGDAGPHSAAIGSNERDSKGPDTDFGGGDSGGGDGGGGGGGGD